MRWGTTSPTDEARRSSEPLRCANCDIEIEDEPVHSDHRTFCCDGCADGGPCVC